MTCPCQSPTFRLLIEQYVFHRLQEQYAEEFAIFKPDKKLRWLPHLGTVHLELQLEDRSIEVDASPLEAAFIELFSEKSMYEDNPLLLVHSFVASAIWTVNDLIAAVGSVGRSAALKALLMWVDHGVLKEDQEGIFRLLETAEERSASASEHIRQGQWTRTSQVVIREIRF
jgi:anaphase-promoting complex subunit 2